MIEVNSNIGEILGAKLLQLRELQNNPDPILREVAKTVLPELRKRVHVRGEDSSGNQIGTYSPGYMKVRTGDFQNSGKVSRGKNKGKLKDAGRFTKGSNVKVFGTIVEETSKVGLKRQRYNRTDDPKVILSLTRQMEGDTSAVEGNYNGASVMDTPTGYGIGYLNPLNYQKALWCEQTYKKPILTQLTEEEKELAVTTAREFTAEHLRTL